jgi:uncharacterized protein (TIRG00374 family)
MDSGKARQPRSRKRRLIAIGLGLAVIAATFLFILPRIANYRAVWHVVKGLSWQQIAALLLATALNLVTFAPPWMAALPGLGFLRAFTLTQASTASTYIAPGGAAVGVGLSYAILRGWGFGASAVALAVAVTGIANQLALLGFPVVALALLTLERESNPLLQTVAAVGLAIFLVAVAAFTAVLSTAKLAWSVGTAVVRIANWSLGLIKRGPVGWTPDAFVRFRNQAVGLLRHRWILLALGTLAGQLSVFVLFLVSLRVLGVSPGEVSAIEAFAAWSLVRLLGSLPITPGGLGVVEVGLTTALVGFGGRNAEVVAAVLVYRFLTIVPTLILGLIAGATWRRLTPAPAQPT